MTAGAGLTSTAFSCGFGCMVEPLLSVLAFSVGASVFGFSSGFFSAGVGAGFSTAAFSGSFGGTSGFLPSASIFSVGAAVFGVSSGFSAPAWALVLPQLAFQAVSEIYPVFYRLHPHFPETEPLSAFLPVSSPPALAQVLHQRPCLAISVA